MSWTFKVENGDIVRSRTQGGNGYEILTGRDKLLQECKMILSTDIRKNGIGSSLRKVIGKSNMGGEQVGQDAPLMFEFQLLVRNSINRYRQVQRQTLFSRRLFSEMLDDFSPVYVYPDPDDPRKFKWRVDFYTSRGFSNFSLGGTQLR